MKAFHIRGKSWDFGLNHAVKPPREFFTVSPEEEAALKEFMPLVEKLRARDDKIPYQGRNDCLRFLRARGLHVNKALTLLEDSQHEKAMYLPVQYNDVKSVVMKALAYVSGEDAEHRPIIYVDPDKFRKEEDDVTKIVKFIIFMMDEAIARSQANNQEQIILLFDLTRFSLLSMDYEVIKKMLHVLMSVYPERVYRLIVFNAPYFFTAAWPMIKPWLDDNSIRKFAFIRKNEKLLEEVDKKNLPTALRGEFVFDFSQYDKQKMASSA